MNHPPDLEAIRQEHESWLGELEALVVKAICASLRQRQGRTQQRFAIASNNWDAFYAHVVDFQNEHDLHGETGIVISQNLTVRICAFLEASTDSLPRSGADSSPTTEANES